MIKAIETSYKGYKFRSRLEARWAVFFDALELRWQYEPEGFELGGGFRYLPDFVLTSQRIYVEIKPFGGDWTKPLKFAAFEPILLLAGPPHHRRVDSLCVPHCHDLAAKAHSRFDHYSEVSSRISSQGVETRRILERFAFPEMKVSLAVESALSARFE